MKKNILSLLLVSVFGLPCALNAGSATYRMIEDDPWAEWWHGEYFSGDWGGYRSQLANRGIAFFASAESNLAWNVSGGRDTGARQSLSSEFGAMLNLEKLIGLKNARFVLRGVYRTGDNLSEEKIGNFFPVQQNYGSQTFMLQGVYFLQSFKDRMITWKIGRIAMGDDFARSPVYGLYMTNAIQGTPKSLAVTNAFSCYPGSVWGTRLHFKSPDKEWYTTIGVYQVTNTLYDTNEKGLSWSIRGEDGITYAWETGWRPVFGKQEYRDERGNPVIRGKAGHYWIGAFYSRWHGLDQYNRTENGKETYAFYAHADQIVYQPDPSRDEGLGIWALFNLAPKESVNILPYQVSGGLFYKGLLPGRSHDTAILGFSYGHFSNDYSAEQVALGQPKASAETVIEAGYQVKFSDFFYVQPNVQYILKPYGRSDISNAWVLGMRIGLTL